MKYWLMALIILVAVHLPARLLLADGVVSDAGTANYITYSINNFTPYRFTLQKANQNLNKKVIFPTGIPASIEPMNKNNEFLSSGGASVSLVVGYCAEQPDLWSPKYQMEIDGRVGLADITLVNNVERTGMATASMEGLEEGEAMFEKAINVFGGSMHKADLVRCRQQQAEMRNAVQNDNRIKNMRRGIFSLAISSETSVPLLQSENDRSDMLISGDTGDYLVIQTLAVRLQEELLHEDHDSAAQLGAFGFERTSQPRLLSGGSSRVVVNLYTHAQYCTLMAVLLAENAQARSTQEQKLIDAVLRESMMQGSNFNSNLTGTAVMWGNTSLLGTAETKRNTLFYQRMMVIEPYDRVDTVLKALENLVPSADRPDIANVVAISSAMRKIDGEFISGGGARISFEDNLFSDSEFGNMSQDLLGQGNEEREKLVEEASALLDLDNEEEFFMGFVPDSAGKAMGGGTWDEHK